MTFTEAKFRGDRIKPDYPSTLRAQGVEADVEVLVFDRRDRQGDVGEDPARVALPRVQRGRRKAALAQEWEPMTRNGEPMPSTKKYSYRFRLTDD